MSTVGRARPIRLYIYIYIACRNTTRPAWSLSSTFDWERKARGGKNKQLFFPPRSIDSPLATGRTQQLIDSYNVSTRSIPRRGQMHGTDHFARREDLHALWPAYDDTLACHNWRCAASIVRVCVCVCACVDRPAWRKAHRRDLEVRSWAKEAVAGPRDGQAAGHATSDKWIDMLNPPPPASSSAPTPTPTPPSSPAAPIFQTVNCDPAPLMSSQIYWKLLTTCRGRSMLLLLLTGRD